MFLESRINLEQLLFTYVFELTMSLIVYNYEFDSFKLTDIAYDETIDFI